MALHDVWQEDFNWHDRMGALVYSSDEDDWDDLSDEWQDYNLYWID